MVCSPFLRSIATIDDTGGGAGLTEAANYAALGAAGADGTQAVTVDTGLLWESDGSQWIPKALKDAIDASTLTIDEALWADSLSLGNGDPVASWAGVNTWSQGTEAAQPTYQTTGGPGNGPYISADGGDSLDGDAGAKAITNGVSYATAIVVYKCDAFGSESIFDFSRGTSTDTRFRVLNQGGAHAINGRRLDADGRADVALVAPGTGVWVCDAFEAAWGAAKGQGWRAAEGTDIFAGAGPVGAAMVADASWLTAGAVSATDSVSAVLMNAAVGGLGLNGGLAAFIVSISPARLSPTLIGQLMAWASSRTGLHP